MPRSIAGQGRSRTRYPPPPNGTGAPASSTTSALTPGNGWVADPGLSVVIPGSGVIMIMPVSVCHHVSTTGQRSPPMYFQYQAHASGLIGSPTDPSRRSDERSSRANSSGPYFMSARIAVGAVYRIVALYRVAIWAHRSLSG